MSDYELTISVEEAISAIEKILPQIIKEDEEAKEYNKEQPVVLKSGYRNPLYKDSKRAEWYEKELRYLKVLYKKKMITRSVQDEKWLLIFEALLEERSEPKKVKLDTDNIRAYIYKLDSFAKTVSNTGNPRKDNNYGRTAQMLEDALNYHNEHFGNNNYSL